jgi:hypothetical protein
MLACAEPKTGVRCTGISKLIVESGQLWCLDDDGNALVPELINDAPPIRNSGIPGGRALALFDETESLDRIRISDPETNFDSWTLFWENGRISAYSESRDDQPDGYFRSWFRHGQMRSEGRNSGGKQDGIWREWYGDGSLRETSEFENGEAVERTP